MKNWKHVKIKEQLKKMYLSYVPSLMKIAHQCGYALAIHGSLSRDLDMIAVPWIKNPMTSESLVIMLEEGLTGYRHSRNHWKKQVTDKPHGRKSYAIPFANLNDNFEDKNTRHAYIDLSVMPLKK